MVDLAPRAAMLATATVTSARRYYVLGILTIIYALNFLDRTIFNVLIEPIKKEFVLSDTTMGLLAGFGFVLFYSLLGIPIARVADRLNRHNIVAIAFAFWSLMTALCGMASSVMTLALARALASAIIALTATCFGQGVGPLAIGVVNDGLKTDYGAETVRYSLLSAAATTMLGALPFVWAARTIRGDIARAT